MLTPPQKRSVRVRVERPPVPNFSCLPLDWFVKVISVMMFFSFLTLLFLLDYSKVVTYKNDAVDHFLEGCLDLSSKPRIVRVGKSSRSEKLEDCLLFNVRFVGSTWAWLFETWLTLILIFMMFKSRLVLNVLSTTRSSVRSSAAARYCW